MSPTSFTSSDEKRLTLKLYRTQEHIRWTHKIKIRPATIALVDSETFWGRWDAQTRTISLARKLVYGHPWFTVISVLRHEMAHQYACEFYGSTVHTHDEVFKKCCETLGVPDYFAKASANLQAHVLDWKTTQADEDQEKLLSKVEKLLALATSSNEHEALLAMEKVREITARYNLEQLQSSQTRPSMHHTIIHHRKKRIEPHQSKICGILVGHFFVQVLFTEEFDATSGDEFKAIELIGTRENVLMAEYVYHFLLSQTEFYLREHKKKGPMSRHEMKSFRFGILGGFQNKLEESEAISRLKTENTRVSESTPASELSLGQALVALKKDTSVDRYIEAVYPRLRTRTSRGQSLDADAYFAGQEEGRRITLHKGVTSEAGNSGRFLT